MNIQGVNLVGGNYKDVAIPTYAGVFNGSSYLSIASSATLVLGNTFTIEMWIYPTTSITNKRVLAQGTLTTGQYLFILYSTGAADFAAATR